MVKFGNYSCLSKNAVNKLLSDGAIWLSFSGAVIKHFLIMTLFTHIGVPGTLAPPK